MTLDIARIKAICFDVDGTLSDTDDRWVTSLEKRLKYFRWLFRNGEVRPFARWAIMCAESPANLVYHLFDRAGLDDAVGRLFNMIARIKSRQKSHNFLIISGMQEGLQVLSQQFPLAVISARDESSTFEFLEHFQLHGYFQAVATALTCRYTKPFPDPVLWAAERLGVSPEDCLMVGDTTVDIRAGKSAGAQTVGVLCGFGQERELRKAGADLILPHTAALVDILRSK